MDTNQPELDIRRDESAGVGTFHITRDGARLAALVYEREAPDRVILVHTEVDDVFRGQGVARKLLDAAVAWARETGTRLGATCPYVIKQRQRDASLGDVLEGP